MGWPADRSISVIYKKHFYNLWIALCISRYCFTACILFHTCFSVHYGTHLSQSCQLTHYVTHFFQVLGACSELRKATISFVPHPLLSASNNSAPTGRIFMKFHIWVFFDNLFRDSKFRWNMTRVTDIVRECHCTLLRTAFFWAIKQRVVVISYRRFGTTYRSPLQGSRFLTPEEAITTTRCIIAQNSAVLICSAAEAWNHAFWPNLAQFSSEWETF